MLVLTPVAKVQKTQPDVKKEAVNVRLANRLGRYDKVRKRMAKGKLTF